ncbi:MAG: bifunctional folylpolyglutamate synthase/dihydrofolate synthase [Rhodobacter sp.]|nr:bifunctional folylpolyglutamate synthase/dihydrofolate synthase [Rhodobacter sp.]MCA3495068.1 bifunctional folylpolyglutamate synthase/dihydrofolate synthase [Rhodobacter sp.]MCA3501620.1 bifunctional folylpolyglutamate synthase/dihydrofolate synthase [Rhodobacter sp.]MCA3502240.1 bifunctional folylpolyglutamate synthase/dihydrofolate synthase [Rhodobacter sp.]MCA3517042.1 bifunctional folylpolyglutamate synthase/dihydrofolate synthase [Rhodobacter sp.]
MMTLHPKVIDLTLDRVHRLLSALDHPERRIPPVIHIAGTNGKGSTLAMIRAGLEAAGQPVHAYTSPHLARFHERIRLAGTLISEPALAALLDECVTANGSDPITFFEITTCAAFLAFARTPADWTLLEVGLGGRLDATNVIAAPRLTVITPVSLDHQQYLGETVAEIAGEKAGILKRRVPCIVGPQTEYGLAVIEARAARLGVPLLAHGQHWDIGEDRGRMIYQDESGLVDLPLPNLPGPHQIQNAGAAIAALRHLGFDAAVCEAAVTQAVWPARMQRLRQGPLVAAAPRAELWLDGGHNPAGGEALAATLARMPKRPTHLICGMLNTKDIGGYLRPLARHADSLTAVSIPGEKNTLPAEETQAAARAAGLSATTASSVQDAVDRVAGADPQARILICGSLYLAGQVLRENG